MSAKAMFCTTLSLAWVLTACGACGSSGEGETTTSPSEPSAGETQPEPDDPAEPEPVQSDGSMSILEAEQDASGHVKLEWLSCELDEDCTVIELSSQCEPCGGPNLALATEHEQAAREALPLAQYAGKVACEEPEGDCQLAAQCLAGSCSVVVGM